MNNKLTGVSAVLACAMIESITVDVYFTVDSNIHPIIKGKYSTEDGAREGIERMCSMYGDSPSDYFVKKVTTTVETLGC